MTKPTRDKSLQGFTQKRAKPFILRVSGLCKSRDTIIVTLNSYTGHYVGLFHIRDKEIQAQFRAGNINKIALIKDKEFISANNFVEDKT